VCRKVREEKRIKSEKSVRKTETEEREREREGRERGGRESV